MAFLVPVLARVRNTVAVESTTTAVANIHRKVSLLLQTPSHLREECAVIVTAVTAVTAAKAVTAATAVTAAIVAARATPVAVVARRAAAVAAVAAVAVTAATVARVAAVTVAVPMAVPMAAIMAAALCIVWIGARLRLFPSNWPTVTETTLTAVA